MTTDVDFVLNGNPIHVATDSRRSLLDILREDLRLTGTKYGCGEGQCRACTVLLDGQPIPSCLTPATAVAGRKVETIEGLATGHALHPVQQAFVSENAMQCGYCVPDMIMATVALLQKNPNPEEADVVAGLNGNLCRCCGYPNILKAVRRASQLIRREAPQ
jgi:aerobic-type carbon monoxide dehydrogenase small subunit (CoxS/CutS family)